MKAVFIRVYPNNALPEHAYFINTQPSLVNQNHVSYFERPIILNDRCIGIIKHTISTSFKDVIFNDVKCLDVWMTKSMMDLADLCGKYLALTYDLKVKIIDDEKMENIIKPYTTESLTDMFNAFGAIWRNELLFERTGLSSIEYVRDSSPEEESFAEQIEDFKLYDVTKNISEESFKEALISGVTQMVAKRLSPLQNTENKKYHIGVDMGNNVNSIYDVSERPTNIAEQFVLDLMKPEHKE